MLDENGRIPKHVVEELRDMADKAKMSDRFEAGERLHALLDAHEDLDDAEELEDLKTQETANQVRTETARERLEQLTKKVDGLSAAIEAELTIESPLFQHIDQIRDSINDVSNQLEEMDHGE